MTSIYGKSLGENDQHWSDNNWEYSTLEEEMREIQNSQNERRDAVSRQTDKAAIERIRQNLQDDYIEIAQDIKNKTNNNLKSKKQVIWQGFEYQAYQAVCRSIERKLSLKESIIAAAFHPKRLQHVLDTFGTIEAWEATVGM